MLPISPILDSQRLPRVPEGSLNKRCIVRKTTILVAFLKTRKDMVRSSGFEPPRYCYRQPLKLVRLPVPPRPLRTFLVYQKFILYLIWSKKLQKDSLCKQRLPQA